MENLEKPKAEQCLNCSAPKEHADSVFCAYCGQKHGTGKVTLRQIITELVGSIFNLDSKSLRTLFALLSPGKLTLEYFKGKHQTYNHPIRLFFVAAIFFFAAIAWNIDKEATNEFSGVLDGYLERTKTISLLDSIKREVLKGFPEPVAATAIDSLISSVDKIYDSTLSGSDVSILSFHLDNDSLFLNDQYVRPDEFQRSSPKTLVDKYYKGQPLMKRIFAQQAIKVVRNGGSMLDFMLSKVPIMMLLMMPFLALFLKLLYYRRNRYFVEHLFFSFHWHAFVFFLGTILFLVHKYLPDSLIGLLVFSIFVYLFLAMKKVYGQGMFKTSLKFMVLLLFYFILALLFVILFSLTSFLLF